MPSYAQDRRGYGIKDRRGKGLHHPMVGVQQQACPIATGNV